MVYTTRSLDPETVSVESVTETSDVGRGWFSCLQGEMGKVMKAEPGFKKRLVLQHATPLTIGASQRPIPLQLAAPPPILYKLPK